MEIILISIHRNIFRLEHRILSEFSTKKQKKVKKMSKSTQFRIKHNFNVSKEKNWDSKVGN